jgi:hypothetical protein
MKVYSASCLCRGVVFEVTGDLNEVVACHCSQCRKTSGHFGASIQVPASQLELLRHDTLAWYESTDQASKGFCTDCGSSLFWNLAGRDGWSVSAGAFDTAIPVQLSHHCFTSEKGDYYSLKDGLPQAPLFDLEANIATKKLKSEENEP